MDVDVNGNPLIVNSHYKMGYGQYAPNCIYLGVDAPPNNTVMLFSCKLHTGRIRKIRRNIHSGEIYDPTPEYDDVWTDSEDTDSDVEGGGYNGVKKTKKRKSKRRKSKKRKSKKRKTRRIKRRYTKK